MGSSHVSQQPNPTAGHAICALRWLPALCLALLVQAAPAAQLRLGDASDRAAFQAWFVFLADAQFYRTTADVTDCAALVRHAWREALRAHTPEWVRRASLPLSPSFADVRKPPKPSGASWPLFRVTDGATPDYAEFANARTLIHLNARPLGREIRALQPGDLLYFRQPEQNDPDHLMVFVGPSLLERDHRDWVVYHTGPLADVATVTASAPPPAEGEVRKVRLADLARHPAPRWRPVAANSRFVGIFRLSPLW